MKVEFIQTQDLQHIRESERQNEIPPKTTKVVQTRMF